MACSKNIRNSEDKITVQDLMAVHKLLSELIFDLDNPIVDKNVSEEEKDRLIDLQQEFKELLNEVGKELAKHANKYNIFI